MYRHRIYGIAWYSLAYVYSWNHRKKNTCVCILGRTSLSIWNSCLNIRGKTMSTNLSLEQCINCSHVLGGFVFISQYHGLLCETNSCKKRWEKFIRWSSHRRNSFLCNARRIYQVCNSMIVYVSPLNKRFYLGILVIGGNQNPVMVFIE